jgi:hypothetical protein
MQIELFLANAANMRAILEGRDGCMARGIVVALVQAEMLWRLRSRLGALHHDTLKRGGQELGIVDVGPSDGCARRTAISFYDYATFYPFFPRSVGLRPTKSPPMRALPIAVSAACHCQSPPPSSSQVSTSMAHRRAKEGTLYLFVAIDAPIEVRVCCATRRGHQASASTVPGPSHDYCA